MLRRGMEIIKKFLIKFWLPLGITVVMLAIALAFTMVLLVRQQITVHINNITIRQGPDVLKSAQGMLKKGEHLNILDRDNGWYKIQREDESTGWVAGWLVERKEPVKHMSLLSEATIELDPGHGGSDNGASSIDKKHFEKNYTLALAQKTQSELQNNYGTRVLMSRDDDQVVGLLKIPKVGEAHRANAFVSFHFDSTDENNTGSGFTSYYGKEDNGSQELAQYLNSSMAPVMPIKNLGVKQADYIVLKYNSVPSALLENGYINSSRDFKNIRNKKYQQTIAKRVPLGLEQYLNYQAKQTE
ncbi:N-acetylmuramoyl-L-alanine amidase [Weissella coleopterorum]|uniref:N-acetylmuramoyl-L-alanine amidase n=1 Tax=Weissella coleopterorum TaxID=2714949 RepID=A0A6G8B148_9LACO|nr:N-acetylmuramoyl-L-alanine amidase [Weissella coleopterorum]QIL50935.1 N-acetylmuramoyl-L-alanine amidase [Weissella coleopterorum]